MPKKIKKEKMSVAVSLIVAIVVFPPVWIATAFVVRMAILILINVTKAMGIQITKPVGMVLISMAIAVSLLIPYLVSRTLYARMRWQTIDDRERRYCVRCGYNLTGNVSGVCPECGTPK